MVLLNTCLETTSNLLIRLDFLLDYSLCNLLELIKSLIFNISSDIPIYFLFCKVSGSSLSLPFRTRSRKGLLAKTKLGQKNSPISQSPCCAVSSAQLQFHPRFFEKVPGIGTLSYTFSSVLLSDLYMYHFLQVPCR